MRARVSLALVGLLGCGSANAPVPPILAAESSPSSPSQPVPGDGSGAPSSAARPSALPRSASPGCGNASAQTGVGDRQLQVGGTTRAWLLSVPKSYERTKAYPLLFVLHGGGGTGPRQRDYFGYEALGVEEKAIVVYPSARSGTQGGDWDLEPPASSNRDVPFFDAMLQTLFDELCIDTERVFLTGSSMGGYMSNQLACWRGDAIRGIAPQAGGGPWGDNHSYDDAGKLVCNGGPVAAMVLNGLADQSVSPTEGRKSLSHWRFVNTCSETTKPASPAPCEEFVGCTNRVVSCFLPNVGHRVWDQGPTAAWAFFESL